MSKQQPEGETVEVKLLGKITAKDLGNPKKVAAMEEANASYTLGRIFGIAEGVKRKDDPLSGNTYWPLVGRFQGITDKGNIIRSGVLYLPSGIHDSYKSAVENLQEGDSLRFAIELRTVKASNPAGYQYEAIDLMPPKVIDLLSEFKLASESESTKKEKASK